MAKTNKTNTASTYAPLPRQEGESLFKHTFTNLRTNAENAGWNLYDPRMSAFVSFVTSDDFLTSFTSHGGDADDAMQFGLTGHQKRLEMADVGQDLTTSDSLAKNIFSALEADDEAGVDALITQSVETPVVASSSLKSLKTPSVEDSAPIVPAASATPSSSVALAYFNRYQQVVKGIVDEGTLEFDDQTIADMKAYGADEPAIIYAGTMAGQDFYGFMTSPESADFVKQGIMENVPVADQTRQLEILDLLKVDAERMVRDFPRAMDGPVADAQAEHLAFAKTINPEGAGEVLDAVGSNHEIVERMASNIVMSMPEIKLVENFTRAVEKDPTLPEPDSAPTHMAPAPLAEPAADDLLAVADKTTPAAPKAEKPASTSYDIQKGDTLSQIVADHYGLTKWADVQRVYETVARNNGIADPDKIYAGKKLVLFDDPTVDLFTKEAKVDKGITVAKAFNPAAEGIETSAPANSPRPALRPEGLVANLG